MSWLLKLFGTTLKIRFEGTFVDGGTFDGTAGLECFAATPKQMLEYLKEYIFVETGKRVKDVKITGSIEN